MRIAGSRLDLVNPHRGRLIASVNISEYWRILDALIDALVCRPARGY